MSSTFAVVSADAVRRILGANQKRVIDLVENAYLRHASGATVNPPSHFLRFPDRPDSRIIALPSAVLGDAGVAGLKWISSFPANLARGLPRASAVFILNDRDTGFPLACLESSLISATRTAASAALAAIRLGRGRAGRPRVGFVGAGLIARHVADYLAVAGLPIGEVRVFDHDRARAARFADEVGVAATGRSVCAGPEELIRGSDLVVFATTAGRPHVTDPTWFDHHPLVLHLSLRDLAPEILLDSVNVLDDVDHCLTADTSPHLAEQLVGHRDFIQATLADVLTGAYAVPTDRTVIFSPFGLGVLDLVLAEFVHTTSLAEKSATVIADFFAGLGPDGHAVDGLDPLPIAPEEAAAAVAHAARDERPVDATETVVSSLVRHAAATPDRLALVHGDTEITYAGLARRVAAVRRALLADGCGAGDIVACLGLRDPDTVAIFVALESIGAVYLPLDSGWPAARLTEILRSSGAALTIDYLPDTADARTALRAAATEAGVRTLRWTTDDDPADLATVLAEIDRGARVDSTEPRYICYTSGTTGVPKGAVVEHRGMVNHLYAKILDLGLHGGDRVGFTASLVFDISVCQMLMPILVGGAGVVVDDLRMRIPRKLCAELRRREVTVLEVVPTVAGWVADEMVRNPDAALPSLRWVVSTGEELRPSLAGRILDSLPNVRLLNAYGFTETSDDVAHHEVRPADLTSARMPVGSPVPNSALYVLVEAGGSWRSARPGEPGELFVGGLPVGRGYLGDRAATRAAYFRDVLDPDSPTGRLYRTGDAAMLRDGLLYCLGRLDRQTKISGVRVEPDEIEATLLRHPSVARCAVFVRRTGIETSVVACYVPADPTVRAETLRAHLAARLPAVMVPDVWLPLEEFPLSTNGKVDYHALEGLA